MAFLDKLKFWKSGDDSLKPLGEGSPESLGGAGDGTEGMGGPPESSQGPHDTGGGIGGDTTPGLGGTGDLGGSPSGMSSEGFSQPQQAQQQPQQGAQPPEGSGAYGQRYSAEQDDSGIAMRGPSYEKPPESGDLKHAPLSPEGRGQSGNEGAGGSGSRDAEIISAKLDAIKANIESINHRLESIERVVMNQERKRVQW